MKTIKTIDLESLVMQEITDSVQPLELKYNGEERVYTENEMQLFYKEAYNIAFQQLKQYTEEKYETQIKNLKAQVDKLQQVKYAGSWTDYMIDKEYENIDIKNGKTRVKIIRFLDSILKHFI